MLNFKPDTIEEPGLKSYEWVERGTPSAGYGFCFYDSQTGYKNHLILVEGHIYSTLA